MLLHYWNKIKLAGDFEVFNRLSQLVICASSLGKLASKELENLLYPIRVTSERVKHLRGGMFGQFYSGGDMFALLEYMRIIFLQEVIASEIFNRALSRQRQELQFLYSSIGFLDVLVAISVFQEKTPYFSFPSFQVRTSTSEPLMEFVDLVHPLMDKPVGYSLKVVRSMLITGSNASGKSTFIKTVAVNAILAQSIAMVLARNYRTDFFKVLTSMSIRDNLEKGESYFVVEAKSMKRLVEESSQEILCLFAIDEIFQGTNSVERLAAAQELLHFFITRPVICLVATHDYELVKNLADRYDNYHFQERIEAGQIVFDYRIEPGYRFSFSALKILGNLGYPSEIIAGAEKNAQLFVQKNWEEYGEIVR